MNKVVLVGRLTKDPEARYTTGENQLCITLYTLAVNRKKKDEADFIRCKAFGRQGEFADKYFKKGMRVAVSGRIETGSYTNREGQKIYTTDVVIEDQEFAQDKSEQNEFTQPIQQEIPFD